MRNVLVARAFIVAIGVGVSGRAAAQSSVDTAGGLYDNAVEAQEHGDYARAAALFARADELVPDPTALEAALGAAVLADDAALGMALVKRSARGRATGSLAQAVRTAQSKFGERVGRLRIQCSRCTAILDGAPTAIGDERWVGVGEHTIELVHRERLERKTVVVRAGEVAEVAASPWRDAAPAGAGRRRSDSQPDRGAAGLDPMWFWTGAGLTVVAASFTFASGLDTLHLHREFVERPTLHRASDGEAAETRTYVLLGMTGGFALATTALGLLAVRWEAPKAKMSGGVSLGPSGGAARLRF